MSQPVRRERMARNSMKKKNLHCVFWLAGILLLAGFCIGLGVDLAGYDPAAYSAPFYAFVLVRVLEFLLPGLIAFCAAFVLRRKFGKE